jgi:RND family efflux transporter MFP subunit
MVCFEREKGEIAMIYQFWQEAGKMKRMMLVGVILILITGVSLYARKFAMGQQMPVNNKIQATVDVAPVQRANLLKRISLTGPTVPAAQVDIAAKYQGKVVAVYTDLGQQVTPGQVLVVEDTGDDDIAIRQNEAAYRQAQADSVTTEATFNAGYEKAKADYDRNVAGYQRNKALYAVGGISKDALDESYQGMMDAKAALDTVTNQMKSGVAAAIESAQQNAIKNQMSIEAVQKQRADLILRAPRSGVIGYRQVEVGDMVSAGQKLLSIYDNSKIYVDCQVSEQDLPALYAGMNVRVGIDSLGKTYAGKIIYISPASDPSTLTFSLRIELTNPDAAVKSGMFTRTIINAVLRPNTLVVPTAAVQEKNGENFVFVLNPQNNTVEQRAVQIGARGDNSVEILSGLKEGEVIALTNLSRLRSGLIITPHQVTQADRGDNQ